MSVINSMLRDLDRRHAPLPMNTNVRVSTIVNSRTWPRAAFALCALFIFIVAMWSWNHYSVQDNAAAKTIIPVVRAAPNAPSKRIESIAPTNRRSAASFATTRREPLPGGSEAASMPPTVAANEEANRLAPQNISSKENRAVEKSKEKTDKQEPAPVLKQERKAPEDLNAERYQLARAALAQNQPQRAYELLRDSPPTVASATDYHAVLAAVEQQLGYYADASLRYQQLLLLDQNQASWWLGLALSLEGEHRSGDALTAYQRTAALNALPDAARQYVTARIAALGSSTGQKVEAER